MPSARVISRQLASNEYRSESSNHPQSAGDVSLFDQQTGGFNWHQRVWLAMDQPDTDFAVDIYEIAADGTSVLLSHAQLRARYRDSLRVAKLVPKGQPVEYRFDDFNFVARRVARGSRLRLVFGPVNSIFIQRNYNSGGIVAQESGADARTVTVNLLHDARHPSALYVPLGAADECDNDRYR